MKYKLNSTQQIQDNQSFTDYLLKNRGIDNPQQYLNTSDKDLIHYSLLENISEAVKCLLSHVNNNDEILIVVDPDVDGLSSSAILYQYLTKVFPNIKLKYNLPKGKEHGLSTNFVIPIIDEKLIIVPDAGSNDSDQCKWLKENNVDVIILDHHEINKKNPHAIIVNPFLSPNYLNKSLSGTAVVYKFLQALDDELWESNADEYLDLVALSIISDSMSITNLENKRFLDLGLSRIKNKAFKAILDKQEYSTQGIINIQNVAFYIVPLCNATIRSGEMEDKQNMFEAFCQIDKEFDYKKRGEKELVKENIYTKVARTGTNLRSKQNREIDKGLEIIEQDIEKHHRNDNKILFANCNELDNNFIGLVAMKLSSKYSKPCVLLHPSERDPNYFTGSIRNYNGSPIEDLKDFLTKTKMFKFLQGHANAAGAGVVKENIKPIIELTNNLLQNVDFDKFYKVDFIFDPEEITYNLVKEFDNLKNIWGQGLSEPYIVIKNLNINTSDINILGADQNTIKLKINTDDESCIDVFGIKFKCNEQEKLLQIIKDNPLGIDIKLEIVGKLSMNVFNGISQPQLLIEDYNILE